MSLESYLELDWWERMLIWRRQGRWRMYSQGWAPTVGVGEVDLEEAESYRGRPGA